MRVGVVGGGPSAFGALARLVTLKNHGHEIEIDLFSVGDPDQEKLIAADYKQFYSDKDVNLIIKTLKQEEPGGLLPPRSFNLKTMQEYDGVNITSGIKRSETFGGLGNYWSSSVFPVNRISDPLLEPLCDIEEHYKFLAELIPISGEKGDGRYQPDHAKRPASHRRIIRQRAAVLPARITVCVGVGDHGPEFLAILLAVDPEGYAVPWVSRPRKV